MSPSVIVSSRRTRPSSRGFGLPALLATAATATLLGTLVLVPLATARRKARLAVCLANLQQVNRAVLDYGTDHGGTLPGLTDGLPGELQWWYKELVKPYVARAGAGTNGAVFACPEDRGYSDPVPFFQGERFDYGSYNFNGVQIPGAPNIAGLPVASITDPKRTLLIMEWTAHAPLSWHRSRTGRRNAPFYNDAESVVGHVDGHASLSRIYYDGYTPAYLRDPIPGYDYRYSGR